MEAIVYLNGRFLPEEQAVVPVTTRGFFGGDGVYEVTRTFRHKLFRLEDHLARLYRSLAYIRLDCGLTRDEMGAATEETLARNLPRLDDGGDFALWHVITRGEHAGGGAGPPVVAMFCVDMDFDRYAESYLEGMRLVTPGVRRTPPQSIDPKGKVTSRMNQVQAALEVGRVDPGAVPLLLDTNGNIAETNTGNFFFFSEGRLHTSRGRNVLAGVTRSVVLELAEALGIDIVEGDFTAYDAYTADEAFVSGTSPSIVPVARLNGAAIGDSDNLPGPDTLRLMQAFSEAAGVDYVAQAIASLGGNRSRDLGERWDQRNRESGSARDSSS